MKTLIILLLITTSCAAQKIDTIFTNVSKISGKKVTVISTEMRDDGSEVSTKVIFDKAKAELEIDRMKLDTAALTKYLDNIEQSEIKMKNERWLIKQKRRVIEELLDKLSKLLKDL